MKVLVVEDQHRIARYIQKGLKQKGIVADVVHDGLSGYELASSEIYDVIILDIMLPQMNGVSVVSKLRKEGNHTPILLLTAKGDVKDKIKGFEAGADDYLPKPFSFIELIARIKALGRRPRNLEKSELRIGDVLINTHSYEVRRGSEMIELSPQEYSLFEFLVRNRGRVFTADQLVEFVWRYDSNILANTVQVYIGYLRKKMDKSFPTKPPVIHTIRGFGYKVDIDH